jgi:hypothetical protein
MIPLPSLLPSSRAHTRYTLALSIRLTFEHPPSPSPSLSLLLTSSLLPPARQNQK